MPQNDGSDWDEIRSIVLPAWEDTDRRSGALLFGISLFGGLLMLAAYFAIPESIVPAAIVAVVMALAILYVLRGRRRLRRGRPRVLSGKLVEKYVHTSTNSATRGKYIRPYFKFGIRDERTLDRTGKVLQLPDPSGMEVFATTGEIYSRVDAGEDLTLVVMPHDGAIYFLIRPNAGD